MGTCQGTYLPTDHSKETDYIVSLVQSTSGLVFSLASLWWIRKECLVRFLLSLWCFQVIVHTSHPFTLVAPSGMPLTILAAQSHWKWDVWNDLFGLQLVTLQFCEAAYSPYQSCCPDRQMEPLSCHYPENLMNCRRSNFEWLNRRTVVQTDQKMTTLWPRGYTIIGGKKIWVCCPFPSLGHDGRLGAVVPRPRNRKRCLLTSLLRTSCLIGEA